MLNLIFLLSPAKSLRLEPALQDLLPRCTNPKFLSTADALVAESLKPLSEAKLASIMSLSKPLAKLNHSRYQHYQPNASFPIPPSTDSDFPLVPAIHAFDGPAFKALDFPSLDQKASAYVESHLRILSGLYGILRPLDLIQPYRLEMGTKGLDLSSNKLGDSLSSSSSSHLKTLDQFWKSPLTNYLADMASKSTSTLSANHECLVVDCASEEYSRAVDYKLLKEKGIQVLRCVFHDNGRVVGVMAKKARGLMVRYAAQVGAEKVQDLVGFNLEGYMHDELASSQAENLLVFNRTERAVKANSTKKAAKHAASPKAASASLKRKRL